MSIVTNWSRAAGVLVVAGGFGPGIGNGGQPAKQPPAIADAPAPKPAPEAVAGSDSADPGIQAMALSSTDIIIADVLETNPSKAEEGARDTVKLKVVRTLLGRPTPGETLGVYYHLLWSDEKSETLEAPKFTKGKRYLIFLRSHFTGRPGGEKSVEYELTDQWLAVLPDHVRLEKEVARAVRGPHGDARGEWSSTDGSIAGLQGRLVAYRGEPSNGTPIISVYLDLRNTAGGNNTVDFLLVGAKVAWTVTDENGKAVKTSIPPGNWLPTPDRKLTLAAKEGGRLKLTVTGAGILKDRGAHLELGSDHVWVFDRQDKGPYFLSGTIAIAPSGERGQWSGTLHLPKVRIPLGE